MELQQQQRDRRPDALGDLRVLPDELLCAILDLLEARDVARLACVSSVLYILCNEEPLWMNLCIRDGGLIEYKGSWRKTFLYRQKIYIDPDGSCENLLQFDGFNSLFLYRRWYRRFTTLDTFSFNNGGLDRKTALSLEEFHSEYDGKKPVLIAELANSWPAKNTWTIEQLVKNYGDVAFRISQRTSKKITMKFRDYVSYMELQHDEDPLYVFDDEFGEAAPDLLKDYNVPHLFQEDFFDVLDRDKRPPFRWMIIGPERSGASWHVDPGLTSAWNTLLTGRKRWALYPPGKVPAGVTVHVNEEDGDINIDTPSSLQWWLDVYPLLADEHKPFECTQLPGETIFVPSGWWHCVLNLETTIAVTQNFVNPSNFEYVCLDLTPGHLHKGVCRAGLLAVEDVIGCASAMDQDDYSHMIHKEKRIKTKPEKELHMNTSILNGISKVHSDFENGDFSYDICFLSKFLDEERDHYNSIWSASNCIGQRETRTWLHKLWVTKPQMRQLTWKGACLALNVGKWSSCMLQICASHKLPDPLEDERFPVGTGSNPVYLVSDYVVKIFVEEGLESSLHNLGTELEFYQLLHKAYSSLREYVPPFVASGILVHENGIYKTVPWDGKRMPKMVSDCDVDLKNYSEDCFAFGVWSKMQFTCRKTNVIARTRMWPYLITKKCKGDIFADVRERVSKDDALNLASFLGHQLRDLHLLPVPRLQNDTDPVINNMDLKRRFLDSLGVGSETPALSSTDADIILFSIPVEYELYISVLDKRRRSLVGRLVQWGHPIPKHLIEKVDEYIPHDIALILNTFKDKDGVYKVSGSLNWLHTDIMDDNILMESSSLSTASLENSHLVNGSTSQGQQRKWFPGHILDFSNLSIGDPMNDLIPIYLDVFRGDSTLLSQLLVSYGLPLSRKHCNGLGNDWKNCERLSYHAMCHCILNEENVLGAIFSLSKGLRSAKSWEEVEEAVWGFLNDYQCSD